MWVAWFAMLRHKTFNFTPGLFTDRRSRSLWGAASPYGAWRSRRARRRHGWTRHSARAAAGPIRFPGCRAARSEPRARRTSGARGACSRWPRPPSRVPPATAPAWRSTAHRARSREPLRHAQQRAAGARVALQLRWRGPALAADELEARARRGGHNRQTPQGRVDLRRAARDALDHAILEGMEAGDREAPAGRERVERAAEAEFELPELVVDEHAQRLKSARRGVLAGLARAHGACDQGGELAGAGQRTLAPRRYDGLRHATREALLAQGGDHLAYLVEARTSDPRRNGFAPRRVHTHVERAVGSEAEAALRLVALGRGHGGGEEHTAGSTIGRACRHERAEVGKRRVHERKPHFVGKTLPAGRDGLRITVECEHAAFSTQGLE